MVRAGAALLDVGARSTAPHHADALGEAEECERLARAIEAVVPAVPVPISADTSRVAPAAAALDAGARVINDVSGLRDPGMAALVSARGASVILMASPERADRGRSPATTLSTSVRDTSVQSGFRPPPEATGRGGAPPIGADPVASVRVLLEQALARARAAGIADEEIVLDPGIGFFRREAVPWDEWDVRVLAGLSGLAVLGRPLGLGVSRKSCLGAITRQGDPARRLAGSLAATAAAVLEGAALIRTHDVADTVDAVRVAERVRRARVAATS
jgi:dihydropteroate synthase